MDTSLFSYSLVTSKRAKQVRLTIKPDGGIVVTKPWFTPDFFVKKFVDDNKQWILDKIKTVNAETFHTKRNPDNQIWYEGKCYTLEYQIGKLSISFNDNVLLVSSYSQKSVSRILKEWLKKEARIKITQALKQNSKRMGVLFNTIRLKDQSTRWGSCSSNKNLNFNWRLIMSPKETLQYVVIHELAHIKHMNHSRHFWNVVEQYDPEYREHRRWLKKHQYELYTLS